MSENLIPETKPQMQGAQGAPSGVNNQKHT